MRINIVGKISKAKRAEIRHALNFYFDHLVSPSLKKKLVLTVRFTPNIDKDSMADCMWLGDDPFRPKRFLIRVWDRVPSGKLIKALGHESVHVKQFATGELRDLQRTEGVSWKGEKFAHSDDTGSEEDYWFAPWEVEAYGLEEGLYVLYKREKRRLARKKKK